MKQKILLIILLTISIKSFSQDSKLGLQLNYPIPVGNNFVGENYHGIIDVGADYRIVDINPINIGVSLNGGVLLAPEDLKVTAYVIQPSIFGELDLESLVKLHPSVGIGYTLMVFDASTTTNRGLTVLDTSKTLSGFNFNFGLSYDITTKYFVQVQYDFIKLGNDNGLPGIPAISFNTNVNIWKFGLGYRL